MQDIPQNTLNETTKTEQSARIDLWVSAVISARIPAPSIM
jgi:phage-related protein